MSDITKVPASFAVIFIGDKICATTRTDGTIGLPGGKSEPGETAVETAVRESYEEGWEIKTDNLIPYITQDVSGREVTWVFVQGGSVNMLEEWKEKDRGIGPILVSIQEMIDSGRGNEKAINLALESYAILVGHSLER